MSSDIINNEINRHWQTDPCQCLGPVIMSNPCSLYWTFTKTHLSMVTLDLLQSTRTGHHTCIKLGRGTRRSARLPAGRTRRHILPN